MNNYKFISALRELADENSYIIGYGAHELRKIEALYNINIQGQFREFMLLAGRCSGGLVGDEPIILYRPAWNVRTQILFQVKLLDYLLNARAYDYVGKSAKTFCFSWENESRYYYLITEHDDNLVYCYDENEESVECTGLTLFEYLDLMYEEESQRGHVICRGELLEIYV